MRFHRIAYSIEPSFAAPSFCEVETKGHDTPILFSSKTKMGNGGFNYRRRPYYQSLLLSSNLVGQRHFRR